MYVRHAPFTSNQGGRADSRPSSRTRTRTPEHASPAYPTLPSTEAPLSVRFEACGHGIAVLATLNDLRHNGELCDVVLKVEDKEFNAHKVVLSANSPYFHAMFTSSYTEASQSAIELHDISAAALEAIIHFLYTSEVYISTNNVQELLPAASMLQITALRGACCEFMTRHLGVANCLGVRAFADAHSCPQLKTIAEEFAKEHFHEVVQLEEFLGLQVDQIVALLSADDLNIQSEEKVYEAMIGWVKHDPANRDRHIADLLEKVRLLHKSPCFILVSIFHGTLIFITKFCGP